MKLTLRDPFDITVDTFWRDVFFNWEFQERLYKEALSCVTVELLEESEIVPGARTRRLAFTQPIEAPAPVRKLFGDATRMEERGRFDPQAKRWIFEMVPERMADKIRITGETWVEPVGETRLERVCALDFSVHIFGIGSLVEKFMGSSTVDSYAKQTRFTRAFIEEKGLR